MLCFNFEYPRIYTYYKRIDTMVSQIEENANPSMENIQFSDIFVMEEIQRLQDLFSDATGVASIITTPDGIPITRSSNFCRLCKDIIRNTEKGRLNCFRSDAILGRHNPTGPIIRTCLSGDLWDAGVSITVGDKHIANWLIGQVKNEKSNVQHMLKYADEIGVDREMYSEALSEIPEMSFERFNKVAHMLFQFVNEMSEKTYSSFLLKKQITEYEQVTSKLLESEEKYRMLVENSHDIIFTLDLDANFTYISPIWSSIMGYSAKQVIGKPFDTFVIPEDIDRYHSFRQKVRDEKKNIYGFEFQVIHKKGHFCWHNMGLMPILNEDGNVESYYGAARDITLQKQAEKEIKTKNEELRKANAVKDKFFSIIAHDLRSPFGSLLGLSKMMAEDLSDFTMDQIQHIAENIYETSDNLYRLLENLLQWSRIQQDLISINLDCVILHQLVNESLNLFKEQIKNKNIEVVIDIPSNMPVYADANIMQTILRNLISNAVKFTPKGGKISISAKKAKNNFIEIFVEDTGIGMNPVLLDNIFRPDVSTGRRGTDNEPSTGLGLLLCKDFIEKLGGEINVESESGKGSVFHFTVRDIREEVLN